MKISELVSLAQRHAGAILAVLTVLIGVATAIALPTQHSSDRSAEPGSSIGGDIGHRLGYGLMRGDLDLRMPNDSTVELSFTTGNANCHEPFTELEESEEDVTIRYGTRYHRRGEIGHCTKEGVGTTQTVNLSRPLGKRPLYIEEVGIGGLVAAPEDFRANFEVEDFDSSFRVDLEYATGNPICFRPKVTVKETASRVDIHLRVVDHPRPKYVQCHPITTVGYEDVFFDKPRDGRQVNVVIDDFSGRTTGSAPATR
ncbi:hypothetical protein CGLAU_08105 [Corynebacterium glaucum]|uniref:Uncharacterized protein n=1 Tax=Corynebacterium glaucum TaxID=187491 RepID=A0A1Q2HXI9_9CORY|nr:hypothetical protein [Corynebacterium glaucum]AQQ15576.1 hypothetical protein CGLAU_08105 [Corynebacterium glaucum]